MKNIWLIFLLPAMVFLSSCKEDKKELTADFTASKQAVLAGENVSFFDATQGQPSSWKWQFVGGTPETSDLSCPVVAYNAPGTYSVTLEVKNADGLAQVIKDAFITVDYNDLNVDFEANKVNSLEDEPVSFTDKTTGLPTSWQWTFASANGITLTSTEQNPQITFTKEGVYSVTLTASNPKYTKTLTKTDYISVLDPTKVEADFGCDFSGTYSGGSVKFEDKSIGFAESWEWTFEGGTPATSAQQNPTVTYSQPGRYKVTLRAYNPGNSSTKEKINYILVVPSNGLTAFFPFNGSIGDAGPSKLVPVVPLETTIIGLAGVDRKSVEGNAVSFDGSGGFYILDTDAGADAGPFNFGTGDYSVSCWVRLADGSASQMVWMESGGFGAGDQQTWMRLYSNQTGRYMTFMIEGAGLNLDNIEGAKTADNTWHHVVCVRQGLVTCVYVDGVKLSKTTTATSLLTVSNGGNFKVGMQESINKTSGVVSYNNRYRGMLDDLIVYKKALTEQEVLELFGL